MKSSDGDRQPRAPGGLTVELYMVRPRQAQLRWLNNQNTANIMQNKCWYAPTRSKKAYLSSYPVWPDLVDFWHDLYISRMGTFSRSFAWDFDGQPTPFWPNLSYKSHYFISIRVINWHCWNSLFIEALPRKTFRRKNFIARCYKTLLWTWCSYPPILSLWARRPTKWTVPRMRGRRRQSPSVMVSGWGSMRWRNGSIWPWLVPTRAGSRAI